MDSLLIRIKQLVDNEGISMTLLEGQIGASKGVLSRALSKDTDIQCKWLVKIVEIYPRYDTEWLLTGKGTMLKSPGKMPHFIPLLADQSADEVGDSAATPAIAYIDPGDSFPTATDAMHHHSMGMKEYPAGCLLILRRKAGVEDMVWGEHCVIEYGDNYLLRTIQPGDKDTFIYAYATDEATYPDGRSKYPPVHISCAQIKRIFQVIGYISKRQNNDHTPSRY